jgi:hypothetical protein
MKGTETPHFETKNKVCCIPAMSVLLANSAG